MSDPSWIERVILLALIAGSAALFRPRLSKVVSTIRGSRPTPDFEISPLGPRIRQFIWEVMLQGKVIQQRPLPGLAHAFVFWGFCAFGLVTVNHVASGFGIRFLSMDNVFGRFYLGFVALWAVAVAIWVSRGAATTACAASSSRPGTSPAYRSTVSRNLAVGPGPRFRPHVGQGSVGPPGVSTSTALMMAM